MTFNISIYPFYITRAHHALSYQLLLVTMRVSIYLPTSLSIHVSMFLRGRKRARAVPTLCEQQSIYLSVFVYPPISIYLSIYQLSIFGTGIFRALYQSFHLLLCTGCFFLIFRKKLDLKIALEKNVPKIMKIINNCFCKKINIFKNNIFLLPIQSFS